MYTFMKPVCTIGLNVNYYIIQWLIISVPEELICYDVLDGFRKLPSQAGVNIVKKLLVFISVEG